MDFCACLTPSGSVEPLALRFKRVTLSLFGPFVGAPNLELPFASIVFLGQCNSDSCLDVVSFARPLVEHHWDFCILASAGMHMTGS
jgi:hypothetical protein